MPLCFRACLWYVSLMIEAPHSVTLVPPLVYKNPEEEIQGRKRYEAQKTSRNESADSVLNVSNEYSFTFHKRKF